MGKAAYQASDKEYCQTCVEIKTTWYCTFYFYNLKYKLFYFGRVCIDDKTMQWPTFSYWCLICMQNFKAGSLTIFRKSNQPTNGPNTLFSGPKFCLLCCLWMQCFLCSNHCGRFFLHVRSCDAEQMLRHNISTHKSLN